MAPRLPRRIAQGTAFIGLFAAAVALGVSIAWTTGIAGVASAAADLDEIDLAIGAVSVAHSATNQAVLIAVDHSNGTASTEAAAAAQSEAEEAIGDFERLQSLLREQAIPPAETALAAFANQARAVLAAAATDEESARSMISEGLVPARQVALAQLDLRRADIVAAIGKARAWPGWLEAATRVAVTLAVPVLLAGVFWVVGRIRSRRSRRATAATIEELERRIDQSDQALVSLSHRFRTPLTSIYGLSDVLVQKRRQQGLDGELITLIHGESAELYRIADDALAATQLASGSMETAATIVAFAEVVDEAVKTIRSTGVDIKVDCPEIWVLTDGAKVQHILRNLVHNAAAHGAEPIFVEVSEVNGVVECDVIDHGESVASGVRRDEVDFSPATGLGLKVAYEMTDLIGAKLEHYRDGDRTLFTLSLSDDDGSSRSSAEPRRIARRLPRPLQPRSAPEES